VDSTATKNQIQANIAKRAAEATKSGDEAMEACLAAPSGEAMKKQIQANVAKRAKGPNEAGEAEDMKKQIQANIQNGLRPRSKRRMSVRI